MHAHATLPTPAPQSRHNLFSAPLSLACELYLINRSVVRAVEVEQVHERHLPQRNDQPLPRKSCAGRGIQGLVVSKSIERPVSRRLLGRQQGNLSFKNCRLLSRETRLALDVRQNLIVSSLQKLVCSRAAGPIECKLECGNNCHGKPEHTLRNAPVAQGIGGRCGAERKHQEVAEPRKAFKNAPSCRVIQRVPKEVEAKSFTVHLATAQAVAAAELAPVADQVRRHHPVARYLCGISIQPSSLFRSVGIRPAILARATIRYFFGGGVAGLLPPGVGAGRVPKPLVLGVGAGRPPYDLISLSAMSRSYFPFGSGGFGAGAGRGPALSCPKPGLPARNGGGRTPWVFVTGLVSQLFPINFTLGGGCTWGGSGSVRS